MRDLARLTSNSLFFQYEEDYRPCYKVSLIIGSCTLRGGGVMCSGTAGADIVQGGSGWASCLHFNPL